ncbi:MAG: right-handed parallel beta-helix repeat-containing protein, partial [bacterium]
MSKKVLVVLMVLGVLIKTGVAQATDVSGTITTDTTYNTTNSPYIVTGDVIVNAGVTLTIEPGVIVKFATNTSLIAYGKLLAVGEQVNKIVFTSHEDETNGQGTSTIAQAGNWMGIKLAGNGANESEIKYCIIKYGKQGIYIENTNKIEVNNSIITNIQSDENNTNGGEGKIGAGIYLSSVTEGTISNNVITNCNGGNGISRNYSTNIGDNGCLGVSVYIELSSNNVVEHNEISRIKGGNGGVGSKDHNSGRGGIGTGIYLLSSPNNKIKNNILSNIEGGKGGDGGFPSTWGVQGGICNGIFMITSNNNEIINNTISNNVGGNGGNSSMASGGNAGDAIGIYSESGESNIIKGNTISNNLGGEGGKTNGNYGGPGKGGNGIGIYLNTSINNVIKEGNIITYNTGGTGTPNGNGIGIYCKSSVVSELIYNNIYNSQTYNLQTDIAHGPQTAEHNWWGSNPPDISKFSGNIDYEPWLTGTYPSQTILLTPTSGPIGTYVTIFGNNFEANEMVRLDFGMRITIATVIANSNGTFATIFTVDPQPCGSTTIRATGITSGKTADAVFFILPKISINPTEGTIGSLVTVAGNGYAASEMVMLGFGTTRTIAISQSDSTGRFSTCFITDLQPYGIKTVAAIGNTSNVFAAAAFAIRANIVYVIPTSGTIGTCVSIAGNGFGSIESICVSLGNTVNIVTGIASSNGTFATTFAVDIQPCGPTTITVRGITSMAEAARSFSIYPSLIAITPISGTVGTMVRIMGNGFAASELVRLSFGNVATINITTTDAAGRFDTSFSVNAQSAGTKTIMAAGMMSGNMVSSHFYIVPKIDMLAPYQGTVGSCVTISGNGFAACALMRIDFGTTPNICSVTSSANGEFSAIFIADIQSYGTTPVRVIDSVSCLTAPAAFRILPHIILITPTNGQIGTFVTVAGNGFGATEAVGIEFGTTRTIAVGNTMSDGRFHAVFTVDNQPMGATTLIVRGLSTNTMDSDLFMILPSVTLKITPLTQNIVKGQEFTAQVEVVDVGQLVTADIWINFNPDILEAVSAGSGTFMQNCSSPGYWIGTGTIKYSFGSFGSPSTGSGVLCFLR